MAQLKRCWINKFEGSWLLGIDGYAGRVLPEARRSAETFLSLFPSVAVTQATLYELCFETSEGKMSAIQHLTEDGLKATIEDLSTRGLDPNIIERD